MYPLLGALSVYSLIHQPQKGWWSWIVRSLANGVYTFGFVAMTPQVQHMFSLVGSAVVNLLLEIVVLVPSWFLKMYTCF